MSFFLTSLQKCTTVCIGSSIIVSAALFALLVVMVALILLYQPFQRQ